MCIFVVVEARYYRFVKINSSLHSKKNFVKYFHICVSYLYGKLSALLFRTFESRL